MIHGAWPNLWLFFFCRFDFKTVRKHETKPLFNRIFNENFQTLGVIICDFYMLYNCDWNTNGKISRTRSFIFIEYVFVCVCAMFSRHNVFSYSEPESISMALGSSIICFVDGRNGPNNSAAWTQFLAIISHVCLLYSCNKQSKRKIWLRWTNNNDDFPRFVFGWCLKRIVLFESINEVCSHYANDYYHFNNFYLLSTA